MNPSAPTRVLSLALAPLAIACCLGCSAAPRPAAAGPTVAFAAGESDLAVACSVDGMPRVIASHVSPMAGVTAELDGSRIWLRFATKWDARAALEVDPATLEIDDEEGQAPHDIDAAPQQSAAKRVASGPVAVALEDGRRLVAWTGGSPYVGWRVEGVTLSARGEPVGAPIDLGYEGSAVGRPAVALTSAGRGVLAFEESDGRGFHLVAARIACRTR